MGYGNYFQNKTYILIAMLNIFIFSYGNYINKDSMDSYSHSESRETDLIDSFGFVSIILLCKNLC